MKAKKQRDFYLSDYKNKVSIIEKYAVKAFTVIPYFLSLFA